MNTVKRGLTNLKKLNGLADIFKPGPAAEHGKPPIGGLRFDLVMITASVCFLGGLFVDGWAHQHGKTDNTFFTPWHAFFYTGFLVVAGVILFAFTVNRRRGYSVRRAIPPGYIPCLVGTGIFAVGGVGDMIWHELFGVEVSTEALLSPTHLLLACGILLIVSGPLRASWHRHESASANWFVRFGLAVPMLISVACTWSLLTFMTQFIHPMINPWASQAIYNLYARVNTTLYVYLAQALGVASLLFQTGLLMGTVLISIRRWTLPFGSFTLIFSLNAFLMSVLDDQYRLIIGAVAAGVATDLAILLLKRFDGNLIALRIFGFAVPAIYYGLYFAVLALTDGVWWSIHLWAGSIVLVGVEGILLSYVSLGPGYHAVAAPAIAEAASSYESDTFHGDIPTHRDKRRLVSRKILRYRRRAEADHAVRTWPR